MSTVACRNCNTPNPSGSKFCNNCGTALPPSTNLICPNCRTANPRDLLYCDNCGTRLVQQPPPKQPAKPKQRPAGQGGEGEEPPAASHRAFSLPSRQPGSTIDLDISSLPDWLKADWTGEEPAAAEKQSSPPPPADEEEILGGWLSQLDSSEPEPTEAAGELPDWFQETQTGEPTLAAGDDLPDWLRDTGMEEPAATAGGGDLPDWLAKAGAEQAASEAATGDDFPEWFGEAAVAETGKPPDLPNGDDRPDWLGNAFDEQTAEAERAMPADDEFAGWLATGEETEGADDLSPEDDLEEEEEDSWPDWMQAETVEPAADAYDDLPDWLKDASLAPGDDKVKGGTDELSQWLVDAMESGASEAAAPGTPISNAPPASADDDMPDWLRDVQSLGPAAEAAIIDSTLQSPLGSAAEPAAPGWLDEEIGLDEETAASIFSMAADDDSDPFPEWFSETAAAMPPAAIPAQPAAAAPPELELPSPSDDLPDWIKEMSPRNTGLLHTGSLPSAGESEGEADFDWFADVSAEPTTSGGTGPLAESGLPDALPDWLADLAPPDTGSLGRPRTGPLAAGRATDQPAGDEPDWLAGLLPPDTGTEEEIPAAPRRRLPDWPVDDVPRDRKRGKTGPITPAPPPSQELEGVPSELASAELPDWLTQQMGEPGKGGPSIPVVRNIPDWLDADDEDSEGLSAVLGPAPTGAAAGAEWQDILGDLPPAGGETAGAMALAAEEIPPWLQALRPRGPVAAGQGELMAEAAAPTSGPLAGIRGAIEIEALAAQPREAKRLPQFAVTKDQQRQVALLHQLMGDDQKEAVAVDRRPTAAASELTRLLLSVLLILAVVAGPILADFLPIAPPALPASSQAMYEAVNGAAGRPVLVVFDYSPAMAGELDPQARMLLNQLATNGSPVAAVSQFVTGVGIAQELSEGVIATFIPGEAIGLRWLAGCLDSSAACETVAGQPLPAEVANPALIILLTGERDSLVSWVEQVGSQENRPLVAAVTQSVAPIAMTYADSGQLQGVMSGLPAAAAYEGQYLAAETESRDDYAGQALAQWLVIGLLLGGNVFGLLYWLRPRPAKGGGS